MEIRGRVHNGVVVLENGAVLPEGITVTVRCDDRLRSKPTKSKRVKHPLVASKHPGTLHLTNERVAEILEDEELSAFRNLMRIRRFLE